MEKNHTETYYNDKIELKMNIFENNDSGLKTFLKSLINI